ncbi:MAG: class I adenylate-forming enzyme family protein [Filomicrobium sp.]
MTDSQVSSTLISQLAGFQGRPPPERFNMARYCLAGAAAAAPEKAGLIVIDNVEAEMPAEVWSFEQLEDHVLRIATGLLECGLEPGDRLLLRLGNHSLYPLVFFGALAAGMIAIPASSQLTDKEVAFLIGDSGARAVATEDNVEIGVWGRGLMQLTTSELSVMAQDSGRANWANTSAGEPAYLIYTSGTTAHPKGVLHAHRAAWGRRPMYQGWYGLNRDDRMLHAGAFNWTFTLGTGLTDPWANAATAIIYTGEKTPTVWPQLIKSVEATLFAAVPGLFRQILKYGVNDPTSFDSLRHGLVAGETPPPGLFDDWQEATGKPLYEALGMSEISTYISTGPETPAKSGTVGKAQEGRAVAILPVNDGLEPVGLGEDGLIAVHRSDPGLMIGYWNRAEEEAEVYRGDWFIGGDLGRMDADGYITHLGRANDVMKALGYRVAPQEVEAALAEHPEVAEVACAEVRVREDLSVIGAFIVPRDWTTPPAPQSILNFSETRLAAYKQPREIRFLPSLPRTANGKVKRSILVEYAEAQAKAAGA